LNKKIINGIGWNTLSVSIKAILLFIQMAVLARTLSTDELGIIVILNIIIGFSYLLADMGISSATIYSNNLTKRTLSQLQFLTISFGIILSKFFGYIT
jgi:O-antigen/teichoic acid export membrane protein